MVTGPLIGREAELSELKAMLTDSRLLTVTGPGGCGKTRLAFELADRVASAELECARVLLSGVGAGGVLDALLAAIEARERFGSTPMKVLLERVASGSLLLVLDNCEHVLGAVRPLLDELVWASPSLRVLATSREPLAIKGEAVLALEPLATPDSDGLGAVVCSDAGQLFVDRAARSDPNFALTPESARAIAAICRQLDGLPLALCLAAARMDTLTAPQIALALAHGRLATAVGREAPYRQRSMRASLDWSYELLHERQRMLLRRVSVFSGGFTTSAAHAVSAPQDYEDTVRGDLQALEAKGLLLHALEHGQERWSLLHTVAEYAADRLVREREDEQLADRHLAWFRAYAARADTRLLDGVEHALIDQDAANLRLALDRALERDPPGALQIAASLMRHWILAEHFQQARSVAAAVLSGAGEDADAGARAIVLCGGALAGMLAEDYIGAIESTQAGLALLADVRDTAVQAVCLLLSSMVLIQTGANVAQGLANAERAVELTDGLRAQDPLARAYALVALAVAAGICDRFDAAINAYEEFLTIPKACEHPRLRTWAEQMAAWAQLSIGSPEQALLNVDRAIALEGRWPSMTYFQVVGFRIHALARMGRAEQALTEGAAALSRATESAAPQAVPAIELALAVAHFMHGDHDVAHARARRLLQMPQLHTLALARETLARIALARGDHADAEGHAGELQALSLRSGSARQQALADYISGCAAILAGEECRGKDLLHAALERCAELRLERDAADVLDELALLAARTGEFERAARQAGAAASVRTRLSCVPEPGSLERLQAVRAQIVAAGRSERWQAAWRQGMALGLADAIAYTRRRRGPRDRPIAGVDSLTPTERDAAQLAAEGLTNPQIAARLFIARGTVKMHLSNAYRKLHVSNRVELTAALARSSQTTKADRDAAVR